MRRFIIAAGLASSLLLHAGPLFAATGTSEADKPAAGEETKAVITGATEIMVGRTLILDASASHVAGEKPEYRWYLDDPRQPISKNVEAIYTPEQPGELAFHLLVRSVGLNGQLQESVAEKKVFVYRRKVVLIADANVDAAQISQLGNLAVKEGVLLEVLQPSVSTLPLGGEEDGLFNVVSDQRDTLDNADAVVMWSDGISALQAALRAKQAGDASASNMGNQTLLLVTERSFSTFIRAARGPLSFLKPKQTVVSRPASVVVLLQSDSSSQFQDAMQQEGVELSIVNATDVHYNGWDVLSMLVNFMLIHGISSQTVLLLLMLPVIATILAFLKQVIGLTTFGLYTPSIVALSFMALGWWIGILFLLFIIATGYVTRRLMRRWRLLYIPKVAIILTVVSITLLILLGLGTSFGIALSRDTVFILLIMSTLAETFLNLKTEEGWNAALLGVGETIFSSLLCVAIVQARPFQLLILAYPELIVLTIVINAFLGRWTGLRLLEYFRFREVFKHLQEE